MRKLWLVVVVAVFAVGVANAQAAGRLDRSFGQNGVVPVDLSPPWGVESARKMAAAPDGSSYVLAEKWSCPVNQPCAASLALFHYTAAGQLDPSFGGSGGAWELSQGTGGRGTAIALDSQGRPLVAVGGTDQLVVYRLDRSGLLDPSFGVGGSATLSCDCFLWQMQLIPGPQGSVTIATQGEGSLSGGTPYTLIHLGESGGLDPAFGVGGRVTLRLPGYSPFFAPTATKNGTVYMSSQGCCGHGSSIYLGRLSAKGRFDWHFFVTAKHSLRALKRLDERQSRAKALLVRPRGKIDLLGYGLRNEDGFSLRMKPDGHLARGYGSHGMRILPVPVVSAALGSDGATMAVSDGSVGPIGFVMRILAGGRLDPKFGWRSIPGSQGDSGISVVPQAGRKALVLDLGLHECRGFCTVDPKLVRFLEGPRRKRR
jgi:uncharacterized delta-60 repeat protein